MVMILQSTSVTSNSYRMYMNLNKINVENCDTVTYVVCLEAADIRQPRPLVCATCKW